MNNDHAKIIASAAKAALGPLGFVRKGRSRLWMLDHGTWLNIVGFKPSPWSVAVDLENAAHWIWGGSGFMSLNYLANNRAPYIQYENQSQFENELVEVAELAASQAKLIEAKFPDFDAIAAYAVEQALAHETMRASWFGYYAGVASGIIGDLQQAEQFLHGISDERVIPRAEKFMGVLDCPIKFRSKANEILAQQRLSLKMAPMKTPPF